MKLLIGVASDVIQHGEAVLDKLLYTTEMDLVRELTALANDPVKRTALTRSLNKFSQALRKLREAEIGGGE